MLSVVVFFLAISVLLYVLLGGADFGMGILDAIVPRWSRAAISKLSYRAIGPVWEANHMWLILSVVILFVGFPKIYSALSVALHIPLSLLLLGIVLRGCAFVFRHYDAVKDGSEIWYARLFVFSSILTPLMMGICIGAVLSGNINMQAETFSELYLRPWIAWFPFSVGVFFCFLCALQASAFLLGDIDDEHLRKMMVRQIRLLLPMSIIAGGLVFVAAELEHVALFERFLSSGASVFCTLVSGTFVVALWINIKSNRPWISRLLVGGITTSILFGWFLMFYPEVIMLHGGESIQLGEAAAPESTLRSLVWALCIGSLLIFPALFYLFAVFKTVNPDPQ